MLRFIHKKYIVARGCVRETNDYCMPLLKALSVDVSIVVLTYVQDCHQ